MSYVNEVFPAEVAKGTLGGPQLSMSVTEAEGGGQDRSRRWPSYRWEYDASLPIRNLSIFDQVYAHYMAVGPENSFPFRDPNDFNSSVSGRDAIVATPATSLDQTIGVGDGVTTTYQLIKTYTFGTRTYVRNIRKPKGGLVGGGGTVSLGVGASLNPAASLDSSTGIVMFSSAPTNGQVVRASYEYYVPVFYGSAFKYKLSREAVDGGRLMDLTLVEDVGQNALTPQFPYLGGGDTITLGADALYDYNWGTAPALLPTVAAVNVTLPDINELPFGGPILWFTNIASSGPKTVTFKNRATGASEGAIAFGKSVAFMVRSDSGRKWTAAQP